MTPARARGRVTVYFALIVLARKRKCESIHDPTRDDRRFEKGTTSRILKETILPDLSAKYETSEDADRDTRDNQTNRDHEEKIVQSITCEINDFFYRLKFPEISWRTDGGELLSNLGTIYLRCALPFERRDKRQVNALILKNVQTAKPSPRDRRKLAT
ncbi:hypothetical protein PUN28_013154 [Cardiocondyla obscurior]|uniref:Uncharacterized protein n=1 Tax=Cardiocondyla obscurior TaxID=286306 RepID=A0AAW2FCT6_9HYME